MKARFFAIAVAMLAISTSASAQEKVSTISVGYSPFGSIETNIKLKDNDEEYKYNYKSFMSANFAFERQFERICTMSELAYSQGSFDKYDLQGQSQWFNPAQQEDIYAVSFTQYIGKNLLPKGAVQFPLYVGIGADYVNGGPFHNLDFAVAGRAKLKFYLSGHFGIYVGGSFRYGFGSKSASESSSSSSSKSYTVSDMIWGADAGLLISL